MDMYDFRMFLRECIKLGQYEELVKILREENIIQSEERPQGEWILQYRSCGDEFYICSVCGRAIEIENGKSVSNFPFCHCGADMRR